ncbi:threonine-phosphate decarboxylase [Algirhabdus cladophorae]|uniref:threonine-phosphate decarboxylase n=1 Tax=Algirhabdus cladophorae TaxID=3377108 RepID=UPI003B848723
MSLRRDHGGGLDAAIAKYGGTRPDWLDLSTGINPVPYPTGEIDLNDWTALPDQAAQTALIDAARSFWNVPEDAAIVAAPGASALIARMPDLTGQTSAYIPQPTYNEHAAAFHARNPQMDQSDKTHPVRIFVHPNNPDGAVLDADDFTQGGKSSFTIIDESFCDICPELSHIDHAARPKTIILKSFGKFWGLAGVRLGFAIGATDTLLPKLPDLLGPWAVAGPALTIGARALNDHNWANQTRQRLREDAETLDGLMAQKGVQCLGGTDLFRLYDVDDATAWQDRLAQNKVWSRIFPYSRTWLRLGLPHPNRWDQLKAAL